MTQEGFSLSPQQRRLRALHGEGGPGAFRTLGRVAVRGPLDPARLDRALAALVREHEILRTTFDATACDGGPGQVIGDPAAVAVRAVDRAGGDGATDDLWDELAAAPRDLARGPVLAVTRVRLAEDRHELLLALPALCCDAAGLDNLVAALARAYDADGAGEPDPDAAQYADIAEWQNELLAAEESRPGVRHWRAVDPAPGIGLAIPFQEAATGAYDPELARRDLPPELAARVPAVAADLGVDARALLLAAWSALLARLSGEERVVVGAVADGRRFDELRDPLGAFERALPLALTVGGTRPFADLARAAAAALADADRWQECWEWPAGDARWLAFGFDHRAAATAHAGGGVTFESLERIARTDRFAARLACEERRGGLALILDRDRGALGAATAERLLGQLEALLSDALARPEAEVGDLDVLAAAERADRIVAFNATDAEYPRDVCPHQWFEEHARNDPDRVAVRQGDRALTYAELDARANQLAHHLRALGVGPDVLVALCIERSVEMVVGILGILKAGGAYVPIDPAYPEDRIRFLLEDTRAPVLLTQASLAGDLDGNGAAVVRIDADRAAIDACPTTRPESGVRPENLVYIIYTSGSTGRPKGVVITHEKLVISNAARVAYFGHTPDTFLLMSSVAFDSSVVGIFWTLCGGGSLLLIPEALDGDLSRIPAVVAAEGVTHLLTLPSVYRLILDHAAPGDLEGLRTVIVAGEACPRKMVDRHRDRLPGVGLFSEYGATETTVFSSVYDCLEQTLPIAPVGGPIQNAQMYVLDERLAPCPTGVPGEVHFGGTAIALGYWRRPELTAERFVPDPFRGVPGARLYKSGDLARHLENGDVEFLGRLDNQVKIRGFRVELEEIEVGLLKHAGLKETAVLAPADENGDRRLVAYAVPEGGAPQVSELRAFLLESLPDYMVPGVFVFLDDFPRTPNGKVDRKALPEPGTERPELSGDYEAPTTDAERALAAIWAEVLRVERVGVRDNFFELGGDSILSIQIVSRAKKAGLALTPRLLFENQTVAELAASADASGVAAPAAPSEQGAVTGAVPLTPVQHWFFAKDLPRPAHWTMPLLVDVARRVEPDALQAALAALCAHHDALRLRFARTEAGWTQAIAPPGDPGPLVAVEDLSALPAGERAAELARRAAAHHASLDLERGPLTRAVLFELGGGDQRLLWTAHHLAVDGVSWRLLLEDLELLLDARERGAEAALPEKTTSYKRWAERLVEVAATEPFRAEARAWAAVGPEDGDPGLPLDRPDGRNVEASARRITVALEADETRALLTRVPKAYNTEINDVLLTALVEAFRGWTGSPSLFLDLEGHGREEELVGGVDLSRTVGWFTTDYPVRLEVPVPFEPGAALRAVKEELRRVPSRGFGYGLCRWLSPDAAALAARPEPRVGFNYLGQFDQVFGGDARFRWCADDAGPSHDPEAERVFALEAWGMVTGGRLETVFEYSEALHDRATVEALAEGFVRVLRALIEHCLSPEAGGFTASDFAEFDWDEADLGEIASAIGLAQEEAEPPAGPDDAREAGR